MASFFSFPFFTCSPTSYLFLSLQDLVGFLCDSAGKESAYSMRDPGSIPGLRRSPGEGKGYPFQYSGLENSMDHIVHGVTKNWTMTELLSLSGPSKVESERGRLLCLCGQSSYHLLYLSSQDRCTVLGSMSLLLSFLEDNLLLSFSKICPLVHIMAAFVIQARLPLWLAAFNSTFISSSDLLVAHLSAVIWAVYEVPKVIPYWHTILRAILFPR